jgi:ribosome recycling factor
MINEQHIKTLEEEFRNVVEKFRGELRHVRGNRVSVELVEGITVNYFEQLLEVKQLGSLSIVPPREIHVSVWDKNAVGAVAKAIEDAKLGLSVSADGNIIKARLSQLGEERRAELEKLVRKTAEAARIHVRTKRDEAMKYLKAAESAKEINEDMLFKMKEKVQKLVDGANGSIEEALERKLKELGE